MTKEPLIQMIQNCAVALEKAATALGDNATWSPLGKGRTALNQIVECAGFMAIGAMTISQNAFPLATRDEMIAARDKALADNDTIEKAFATLRANATSLTAALADATDESLQTVVRLPFAGGMDKTIAEFVTLIYWNATYHEGQINYISTLL